jgi:hypothetical protein
VLDAWCLNFFFFFPAHCLPGEYLNARAGECRLVTNASETQMFECTTGMRFYRCPLGDISCPGSSKICYETNKPPLVCEKDTTLAHCLQCRAAESAELYVKSVFIIHVGCTCCVTSSTDNIMKIHARITLTVECIRTCIFICLFYV